MITPQRLQPMYKTGGGGKNFEKKAETAFPGKRKGKRHKGKHRK
jgi:hypothetical protein